ncbi:hypothetical protein HMPREF9370_0945 [Neisseria wadsworthii 9715]|uniref:Uncharacterized protein n=1 Tax=Neisseria wadsworthii 9715 TaxID=1030841 RepID=G4CPD5_9NEIS|nr:hypothetical protein HMPREF9370_0945 [Neisseria wadsworthii 9715]
MRYMYVGTHNIQHAASTAKLFLNIRLCSGALGETGAFRQARTIKKSEES